MKRTVNQQEPFWKSLSKLDWAAVALCVLALVTAFPALENIKGVGFFRLLGLLALFYVVYRYWSRWRNELMWSLRNRLIVTYVFLAVVPVVLLLLLASLLGRFCTRSWGPISS